MKYIIAILFLSIVSIARASYQEEVLASVIINEAGGEGYRGMQAVAAVIQNRTSANKTAIEVVLAPKQFSCVNGISERQMKSYIAKSKKHKNWNLAFDLARKIISKNVVDITNGATHYCTVTSKPAWAKKLAFVTRIGNHKFYRA